MAYGLRISSFWINISDFICHCGLEMIVDNETISYSLGSLKKGMIQLNEWNWLESAHSYSN